MLNTIKKLQIKNSFVRLFVLKHINRKILFDKSLTATVNENDCNLNIHTFNSFSPYSPSMAVYMANRSGLKIAGICDFGTTAGVKEFYKGCKYFDIKGVLGVEMNVKDDLLGKCMISFYGVNKSNDKLLKPILFNFRQERVKNIKFVLKNLEKTLKKLDISIDLERDVYQISNIRSGGTITSRHVLMAVAKKLILKYGKGKKLIETLYSKANIKLNEKDKTLLLDENNPFYEYDVITVLRDSYTFENCDLQLETLTDMANFASKQGLVCALQLKIPLNVDGVDKEQFIKLLDYAKGKNINAITFATNNLSNEQLEYITDSILSSEMLPMIADKIEYPRNKFDNIGISDSVKKKLVLTAYAIYGNTLSIHSNCEDGIFSTKMIEKCPDFNKRLQIYVNIGKNE